MHSFILNNSINTQEQEATSKSMTRSRLGRGGKVDPLSLYSIPKLMYTLVYMLMYTLVFSARAIEGVELCGASQATFRIEISIDNYYDKEDTKWELKSNNQIICEKNLNSYPENEILDTCCLDENPALNSCYDFTIHDSYYGDGFYYGGLIRLYYKDTLLHEREESESDNFGAKYTLTFGDYCPTSVPSSSGATKSPSAMPSKSFSNSPTETNQPSNKPATVEPSVSPTWSPTISSRPSMDDKTETYTSFVQQDEYGRRYFPAVLDTLNTITTSRSASASSASSYPQIPNCSTETATGCLTIPKSMPKNSPYWSGTLFYKPPICNHRTQSCTYGIPMSKQPPNSNNAIPKLDAINLFQKNKLPQIPLEINDDTSGPPPSPTTKTNCIVLADINNDGHLDIIVGNEHNSNHNDDSNLYILINHGTIPTNADNGRYKDGSILQHFTKIPLDLDRKIHGVLSIVVADLNNDQWMDVIVGTTSSNFNRIYMNDNKNNNNSTSWVEYNVHNTERQTTSIAVGDMNQDGFIDIILGNKGSFNSIYYNQGSISTDNSNNSANHEANFVIRNLPNDDNKNGSNSDTSYTESIAIGDFNNDNRMDIIVGNRGDNYLYLQDEQGTFDELVYKVPDNSGNTLAVAVGDLDGDGFVDIVFGNDGKANQILMNNGTSSTDSGSSFATLFPTPAKDLPGDPNTNTESISLADIDNDGYVDIVVANGVGQNNELFLNSGSSGEFAHPFFDLPGVNVPTKSIATGDIDKNGMVDIISGHFQALNELLLNGMITKNGYDDVEAIELGVSMKSTFSVSVGDLNGDGNVDIFVGNDDTKNLLFMNNGDGSFYEDEDFPSRSNPQTSASIIVDVDNDGYDDIITVSIFGRNEIIMNKRGVGFSANRGRRSFQRSILPSFATVSIAVADIDNDGYVDIILGNKYENKLLINKGNGIDYDVKSLESTVSRDSSVAVADVNNDGYIDIIVGNSDESNELYINSGDGTFLSPIRLPGGKRRTRTVALSDVNQDGFIDIIFGNLENEHNQLLMNLGTAAGEFSDNVHSLPGGFSDKTHDIVIADLNYDGMDDIIVGNKGSVNQILFNQGGKFEHSKELPGGTSDTRSITVSDINNDGMLDIIVGNGGMSHLIPYSTCVEEGAQLHTNSWCYNCPNFMGRHLSICRECMPDFIQGFGRGEQCNQKCPLMQQRVFGENECYSCNNGTFYNSQLQRVEGNATSWIEDRCVLCETGSYATTDLSVTDKCMQCRPGQYQNIVGASACNDCENGEYQPAFGQDRCIECKAGGYCNAASDSNGGFTPCRQGYYNDIMGSGDISACKACPIGTFSITVGSNSSEECQPCPFGTYNDEEGQQICKSCPVGTYQNETNATSCMPCESGDYADKKGLEECIECPYRLDSSVGSEFCTFCAEGFFLSDLDFYNSTELRLNPEKCEECPLNATCNAKSTIFDIIPNPNYWRRSRKTPKLYYCENEAVCKPRENITFEYSSSSEWEDDAENDEQTGIYCIEGHTGPLCQSCVDHTYFKNQDGVCNNKCPNSWVLALRMLGIGFAALVVVTVVGYISSLRLAAQFSSLSLSAKIKLLVSFYQVLASFIDVYGIRFHEVFMLWTNVLKILSLDFFQIFFIPVQCIGNTLSRLLLNATWPYMLVVAGMLILLVFEVLDIRKERNLSTSRDKFMNRFKKRAIALTIVVFYFTLPSVSQRVFDVLKCRPFESGDSEPISYMVDDLSMRCAGEEYNRLTAIFYVFFAIWTLVVPICFLIILWIVSPSIKRNRITYYADTCRFLWGDYDPSLWYWDVIDTIRKLFLTCFVLFIDTDNGQSKLLRLVVALIVCAMYHTLLLSLRPYKRSDNYYMAIMVNLGLICCFCLGIILKLCDENNEDTLMNTNESKCDGLIGYELNSYRASILVVTIGIVLIVAAFSLVVFLLFNTLRNPSVRIVKTGYHPNLELSSKHTHHVFMSHVWETGQATTHTIVRKMQLLLPGLKIWLDVDALHDISLLEESVEKSAVFILFYSRKYFQSKNCRREIYEAVYLDKPIILLHENGEKEIKAMIEECHKYCQSDGFNSPSATQILQKLLGDPNYGDPNAPKNDANDDTSGPIQWLKDGGFSATALNRIYLRILIHLPHYIKFPKELDGGLIVPGEIPSISLKSRANVLVHKHNLGCEELAEEVKKSIPSPGRENMTIMEASEYYKSRFRRTLMRRSDNAQCDPSEDSEEESLDDGELNHNMYECTYFLVYLNKFTFNVDDDAQHELSMSLQVAMDDPNTRIILVHEQDEQKGACDFGDYFRDAPFELINGDPYTLFKDIAIFLHKEDAYRIVSLRQIVNKMGGQQTNVAKSQRSFDTFLSYRRLQ